MNKQDAVASLGESSLLLPARVRAALKANDRIKLYLTVLQAASAHAASPAQPPIDLAREIAAADITSREDAAWLRQLPASASQGHDGLHLPDLSALAQRLGADLGTLARPLLDDDATDPALRERVAHWEHCIAAVKGQVVAPDLMAMLTRGRREDGDSLHLLVMDLHKTLNRLAARITDATVDGAHVWGLAEDGSDHPRVAAFMRGLERTRALKFDHPGLDTAATRDGSRLLIQNDIGTSDAHVLVLGVEGLKSTLTYSDLHRQRFGFFQDLLGEVGAHWSSVESRTTAGLNAGDAYHVGTATFSAEKEDELLRQLEGIGARIVYLIDWNQARKRLLAFVGKNDAVAVLREAARREAGHMAWLRCGAERLVWSAMAAQGEGAFRLGDRLDEVIGAPAARDLLVELLELANRAMQRRQPVALVADEAQLLIGRRLMRRRSEFDLLEEHAAFCHALAQALRDGLAHGVQRDGPAAERLSARAKTWERQADELVIRARARAERQPQWQPFARLIERSDDVADALEEAAFVLSLVADGHHQDWNQDVQKSMQALADGVLAAMQNHVKSLAVAGTLHEAGDADDHGDYLDASWRVLQGERQCDELLRVARRSFARNVRDPASLLLSNELAAALELASDKLLGLSYGVRDLALRRWGVSA